MEGGWRSMEGEGKKGGEEGEEGRGEGEEGGVVEGVAYSQLWEVALCVGAVGVTLQWNTRGA